MLPELNLDQKVFGDIVAEAKEKIDGICSEWTDYNLHDPGITLIELFAWFKEIQQYYLNQSASQNLESYLKLLGMERYGNRPAQVKIDVSSDQDVIVPVGTRLYAGHIPFETAGRNMLTAGNMSECVIFTDEDGQASSQNTLIIAKEQLKAKGNFREYPFGKEVRKGNAMFIGFDKPLPVRTSLSLFVNVAEDYPMKRNPINDSSFVNLAELTYEYYCGGQWRPILLEKDETYGFLQDGSIYFMLEHEMEQSRIGERTGYYLKLSVQSSEYDIPPMLVGLSMNIIQAEQKETLYQIEDVEADLFGQHMTKQNEQHHITLESEAYLSIYGQQRIFLRYGEWYKEAVHYQKRVDNIQQRVTFIISDPTNGKGPDGIRMVSFNESGKYVQQIGIGDGLPEQEFQVIHGGIIYDRFEIMVQSLSDSDTYSQWTKVRDFFRSGPSDKHYVLDAHKGRIVFGNGRRGMAPEGKIMIAACAVTEGMSGNVKQETITKWHDSRFEHMKVCNDEGASGGRNVETIQDCFQRFQEDFLSHHRLITGDDYINILRHVPGLMIEQCKVMEQSISENEVSIVIKPFSFLKRAKLSQAYVDNIQQYLDDKRMVGTKINIQQPEYIEVSISACLTLNPDYLHGSQQAEQAVYDYFQKLSGGFGAVIRYSQLYGALDRLEAIVCVRSLHIDPRGERIRILTGGDVELPPWGLALLKSFDCDCHFEQRR